MAQLTDQRPGRRAEFAFQGFVKDKMVFNGTMIGVPIHVGDLVGPAADS
jgi:3-hydroxyacyl-[acyl-carrier-protein] dehydratase